MEIPSATLPPAIVSVLGMCNSAVLCRYRSIAEKYCPCATPEINLAPGVIPGPPMTFRGYPRNHSGATDDIPGVAWRVAKTVEIPSGTVILVFLDDFLPKVKVVAFGLPHFGSKVQ